MPDFRTPVTMQDAASASGGAFLISELEKRDTKIREPLTSLTYARDIPITVGGGWVENVSAMNITYANGRSVSDPQGRRGWRRISGTGRTDETYRVWTANNVG